MPLPIGSILAEKDATEFTHSGHLRKWKVDHKEGTDYIDLYQIHRLSGRAGWSTRTMSLRAWMSGSPGDRGSGVDENGGVALTPGRQAWDTEEPFKCR
jgi:hypothetical protein